MWPIVPTFTCGLDRSNFSFAIALRSPVSVSVRQFKLRRSNPIPQQPGADDRDRTGDLVLTKDVLCQLSYIGLRARLCSDPRATADESANLSHRSSTCPAGARAPDAGHASRSSRPRAKSWSGRRGSNPRPTAWKAVTLPLSYSRLRSAPLARLRGRSVRASPLASLRHATYPSRRVPAAVSPAPFPARHCSLAWPASRSASAASAVKVGGEGRIRTFEAAGATDLQSVAFDRFATSPESVRASPSVPDVHLACPAPRAPGASDFDRPPSAWNGSRFPATCARRSP